ncbi:hypothetical protein FXW78_26445 [Rhodococcus opacus]|nr:hypothetical protein [Rhodococcus opacus]
MRLRDEGANGTDRDPVAVVHAALDAGITMVDIADAYQNEELIGRTIRGRRDEVLLASKFGRNTNFPGPTARSFPPGARCGAQPPRPADTIPRGVTAHPIVCLHPRAPAPRGHA